MNVSAVLVTRGDVPLDEITASLEPLMDEIVVWDNSKQQDLAVYGRYAGIAETKSPLVYVQDDDCLLTPEGIKEIILTAESNQDAVVANMPPQFRAVEFYEEHALVGFGACFHRDAPARAFERLFPGLLNPAPEDEWWNYRHTDKASGITVEIPSSEMFQRTCDIVFTALTPRVLVDVPVTNLWWAEDETRMYRQESHVGERTRMLELVKQVRDAEV